jgi:formamidopyrimidine-DNA glycosylase
MPELPEVQTTVSGLKNKVLKRTFVDVWTDTPRIIKRPCNLEDLKHQIKGKKIEQVRRRGKNILFDLSDQKTLLVHQKMTGHLLLGKWEMKQGHWQPAKGPLLDPMNRFIHLVFILDNGQMLALSDLRKFAKVELWEREELERSKEFTSLGPEPLSRSFTLAKFKQRLDARKTRIKQTLMDQRVIAGIGNIYSDEILWQAKVNPFKPTNLLSKQELRAIYLAMRSILKRAVEMKGTSVSDYRDLRGEKGMFGSQLKVYRKEGEGCPRCGIPIKRKKIGGRSAHFCPKCQG